MLGYYSICLFVCFQQKVPLLPSGRRLASLLPLLCCFYLCHLRLPPSKLGLIFLKLFSKLYSCQQPNSHVTVTQVTEGAERSHKCIHYKTVRPHQKYLKKGSNIQEINKIHKQLIYNQYLIELFNK